MPFTNNFLIYSYDAFCKGEDLFPNCSHQFLWQKAWWWLAITETFCLINLNMELFMAVYWEMGPCTAVYWEMGLCMAVYWEMELCMAVYQRKNIFKRILLKWSKKKQDMGGCNAFMWLSTRSSRWHLRSVSWFFVNFLNWHCKHSATFITIVWLRPVESSFLKQETSYKATANTLFILGSSSACRSLAIWETSYTNLKK